MEVFLNRAFDKLKKDGRAKQYAAVRDACDKARDALRDDGSRDLADGYVAPLVLACKTRRSALMVTALDCFQKLVAHGYLRGVARHTLDEISSVIAVKLLSFAAETASSVASQTFRNGIECFETASSVASQTAWMASTALRGAEMDASPDGKVVFVSSGCLPSSLRSLSCCF